MKTPAIYRRNLLFGGIAAACLNPLTGRAEKHARLLRMAAAGLDGKGLSNQTLGQDFVYQYRRAVRRICIWRTAST